jgi:hypothetical protein
VSFLEVADLADASSFRRRLVSCVAKCAGQVMAEAPTGKSNVDTKRNDLAREALRDPVSVANRFVWGVLSNVSIAAYGLDATDQDLEFQVGQMWSTVAGVTVTDENEQLPE